ncbi:MAG TPA: sulfite dehydrogenase [Gammaproteobacteria bacterium]|nr:sulfite dehydrogenase [Gammaproteobacteria bacterium]
MKKYPPAPLNKTNVTTSVTTDPAKRRLFLKSGLLAGAGLVSGSASAASSSNKLLPHWSRHLGPGVASTGYGVPSRFETDVQRKTLDWLRARRESSVSFSPLQSQHGIITPSGLVFERHHAGIADIDPNSHYLLIHGLVERPLKFTLSDLMRFPSVSRIHFLECAANGVLNYPGAQYNSLQFNFGMLSCCEWTGVPLSTLLKEAGVRKPAKWILAEGADAAALTRSIPLDKALDDTLVVYAQNGEMLRPEQGYPMRLLLPGWEGIINVKWLRRLELGDKPWETREETATYTDLMPDGKARQYTFVMETKSVITSPCPENPMAGKGRVSINGLAWSGHGRIKRVDVSVDGGRNWRTARLQGPVQNKSLTRFSMDWDWNGEVALLQSRAIDETGYVQPTMAELRKIRGIRSFYHNNSIQTWLINKNGEVENVQLA